MCLTETTLFNSFETHRSALLVCISHLGRKTFNERRKKFCIRDRDTFCDDNENGNSSSFPRGEFVIPFRVQELCIFRCSAISMNYLVNLFADRVVYANRTHYFLFSLLQDTIASPHLVRAASTSSPIEYQRNPISVCRAGFNLQFLISEMGERDFHLSCERVTSNASIMVILEICDLSAAAKNDNIRFEYVGK